MGGLFLFSSTGGVFPPPALATYATGASRVGWTASSSTLCFCSYSTVCSHMTLFWDRKRRMRERRVASVSVHDWWKGGPETSTLRRGAHALNLFRLAMHLGMAKQRNDNTDRFSGAHRATTFVYRLLGRTVSCTTAGNSRQTCVLYLQKKEHAKANTAYDAQAAGRASTTAAPSQDFSQNGGSLSPAKNSLSVPSLSTVTNRMTPPELPSRDIASASAFFTNAWHSALVIPSL